MRTPREITEELVRLSIANDIAQADLFADEAVHELPFSPTGQPIRFTKDQIRAMMAADGPELITDRRLERLELNDFADNQTVLAEYEMVGMLAATGEPVSVSAAMVVTTRDGLILRSRAYLNPDVLRRINVRTE